MTKADIIAQLPHLSAEERAEVQAKLDELSGESWHDRGELSDDDKATLDAALVRYENDPDAGAPWDEVKSRIQSRLRS